MNDILIFILATYTFGIPLFVLGMFAECLWCKDFKDFYFGNDLIIKELNVFGKFCYYILTSFCLFYYYVWIILSWFVKLVFLKR